MHLRLPATCVLMLALAACRPAGDAEAPAGPAAPATDAAQPADGTDAGDPAATDAVEAEPEYPELEATTLDGAAWDLAAHRGRWVVVNFWATWCTPCLKEMPELSALDAMREHVEVIGLAYEDIEAAELKAFLEKRPVVYPVAIVDVYEPPADFATPRGLPMTYLIAPDGRVAKKFLGPVTAAELEGAIAEAGKGTAPAA